MRPKNAGVGAMFHRILAGIVVLGFGSMAEMSAAADGRLARSSFPLVSPGQPLPPPAPAFVPPQARGFRAHIGAFGFGHNTHFLRFRPWWGAPPYVSSGDAPWDDAAPVGSIPLAYPPFENFSERSRPPVFYRPGCRTDTQKVPSESGGEVTINITRC